MKANGLVSNDTVAQYKVHSRKAKESSVPNRLNRQFDEHSPYSVIVSDLTYVRVGSKWHCICLLANLFNREIVGYSVGSRMTAELVHQALSTVKENLNQVQLFHSDQIFLFKKRVAIPRIGIEVKAKSASQAKSTRKTGLFLLLYT
ncbi:Integrase core domain-containing protein [Anoxynatronum buryatiense]|uniref:Integrase core domain-containing protein n=2 Tax=Anoxynatronum buryatiense TaxID=489973 RepID=A0AA45WYL2_9CLOT|nr:Integrase core domain-containing protein [Anoxynatronum buryatiense]